jgi:hypothetical protein
MKALATIATGPHRAFLARSECTFRAYAQIHGYEFVLGDGSMPLPRHAAWAKIPLIRELLDAHELVFWIDADAMILDSSEDVAALLRPDAFQGLVSHEPNGPNTGVWMIRRCDEAIRFLDTVWTARLDTDVLGWWDNSAVLDVLGWDVSSWPPAKLHETEWDRGTQWLPERWNRATTWTRDWRSAAIHHVAGERRLIRLSQMEADSAFLRGRFIRAWFFRLPWRVVVVLRRSVLFGKLRALL